MRHRPSMRRAWICRIASSGRRSAWGARSASVRRARSAPFPLQGGRCRSTRTAASSIPTCTSRTGGDLPAPTSTDELEVVALALGAVGERIDEAPTGGVGGQPLLSGAAPAELLARLVGLAEV